MKKKKFLTLLGALCALTAQGTVWQPADWPVLKTYDEQHLQQIALPLGGIGTGTVSLGGRGELRDWEIMNVPAKGYSTVTPGNNAPFFAIYVAPDGGRPTTTLLAGPLYANEYLHYEGRPVDHHGLPRFDHATFRAAYPLGQVELSDAALPVTVRVKGFNPLVPGDADASGLPIAVLTYEVTNTGAAPATVSVCGSLRNFIGRDGSRFTQNWKGDFVPLGAKKNRNRYRTEGGLSGIYMDSEGVDPADPAWGDMALTTQATEGVTYRTTSTPDNWNNAILSFWDDFCADGQLTELPRPADDDPMASLAVCQRIEPGETRAFTFFLTWRFPNRKAWASSVVGNYYCEQFPDAWTAAERIVPRLPELEAATIDFVDALLGSSYPDVVKEAALFNLATLRSQTVFRLPSGHLMGWEGVMDRFGSCMGSCTHVWNYETATAFLFGELARTMRDVEFQYATRDDGQMSFRAALPLSEATKGSGAAADGQMGCLMKLYRDWQLSGDRAFLERHWEQAKKVLAYAWRDKGWDGNRDGVMEGRQHNTMDVDYFGPNPQMEFWYLGALRATGEMARAMGDKALAKTCDKLYEQGRAWTEKNLFNGEYFGYIAGTGAFTEVSYATSRSLKNALGHLAYVLEGVKSVSAIKPLWLKISTPGKSISGKYIYCTISNSTSVGGILKLGPDLVSFNDGLFELVLVKAPRDIVELGRLAADLLVSNINTPLMQILHVPEAYITASEPLGWTLDGENGGKHRCVHVKNLPGNVKFVKSTGKALDTLR